MILYKKIYLASRSSRRRELLKQIGVNFDLLIPDVNEAPLEKEAPTDYVLRISRIKAEAGWTLVAGRKLPRFPVLAADTVVVSGRQIIGKPSGRHEAMEMLRLLSASSHKVLTAVSVAHAGRLEQRLSVSKVRFKSLTEHEIRRYAATGEPLDKAGAYAIQGHAAAFIEKIEGSYSGVMGLPLYETAELLAQFGIEVL
ncbi:MAG: septum formation protein Maf [Betaproteobacteria bacterium CG2_30_59_46]|nr:MAG: septum formation protein Maf [Betaproteobacteria bacterium CG2_30_59_46]PIQ13718.1 MAG: septum formation inhibitor Maf [Hydrogenophilales bacterium CG18_big_fil_WC_8_21_14_2_50_58_12]PIY01466.1 MAG: septum formation inhibitor Maf [Hydrogenophilales bacterium CG_4_10_14_3_um_filter_58_23]PJB03804.1 MAG: septum formation inhibitor Maf [Hydrogenophilales bacterium CG_4_9_14_3_um_filter_59_35]